MEINAVIFDADGVIFDSLDLWDKLPIKYLEKHNKKAEKGLLDKLSLLSLEEGAIYLNEHYHLKKDTETIICELSNLLSDFYINEVNLNAFIIDVLNYFKERCVPMIIATSGDKHLVEKALNRLSIKEYFQDVVSCADVGVGKYKPKIYEYACNKLFSVPSQTLVVEDTPGFIKTAKLAGFHTLAIQIQNTQNFSEYAEYCDKIWYKDETFYDLLQENVIFKKKIDK